MKLNKRNFSLSALWLTLASALGLSLLFFTPATAAELPKMMQS